MSKTKWTNTITAAAAVEQRGQQDPTKIDPFLPFNFPFPLSLFQVLSPSFCNSFFLSYEGSCGLHSVGLFMLPVEHMIGPLQPPTPPSPPSMCSIFCFVVNAAAANNNNKRAQDGKAGGGSLRRERKSTQTLYILLRRLRKESAAIHLA